MTQPPHFEEVLEALFEQCIDKPWEYTLLTAGALLLDPHPESNGPKYSTTVCVFVDEADATPPSPKEQLVPLTQITMPPLVGQELPMNVVAATFTFLEHNFGLLCGISVVQTGISLLELQAALEATGIVS